MTHWPYIHADETYFCIQKFFSDSYYNLYIEGAHYGLSMVIVPVLALVINLL